VPPTRLCPRQPLALASATMPRDAELSTAEREFVLAALRKDLRTDGRAPYDLRDVALSFGAEFGFCECRLGTTRCLSALQMGLG